MLAPVGNTHALLKSAESPKAIPARFTGLTVGLRNSTKSASRGGEFEFNLVRSRQFLREQLDMTQGRNKGQPAIAKHRVAGGEVHAVQGDGCAHGTVEQLQPVLLASERVGEPFVDGETGRRCQCHRRIREAGCWRGQSPFPRHASNRVVLQLQTVGQRVEAIGRRVEERNGLAIFTESEARVQSRRAGDAVAPHHEIPATGDGGVRGKDEFSGIAVIGETPARHVDGSAATVVELDPIRESRRVGDASRVVRRDLVDHHFTGGRHDGLQSGRAIHEGARAPVRGCAGVAVWSHQLQRVSATVGGCGPAGFVIVVNGHHRVAASVEKGKPFPAVGQCAPEIAGHHGGWVACGERCGIRGVGEQPDRAGLKNCVVGNEARNAIKAEPTDVHGHGADVLDLDKLERIPSLGIVHDFRDAQWHTQFPDGECGLVEGAPGGARPDPRLDGHRTLQSHGAAVLQGVRRDRAARIHPRIGAVGRVVDGPRRGAHGQEESSRHAAPVLVERRCGDVGVEAGVGS